jgi:hypothetical protein
MLAADLIWNRQSGLTDRRLCCILMNNLDYRAFEPWLADDFRYASQWVFDEISSKAAYEAYIVPKLRSIQRTGSRVWAELAYTRAGWPSNLAPIT